MLKDLILELLSQDGYYTLNKKLVKLIGLENSFLLSFFIDKYKFFKEEFFYTKENILNDTRLTEYSLNSSLKFLKDNELIFIVKKGCPARNYYDINFKRIEDLLNKEIEIKKEEKTQENPTTSSIENNSTSDFENLITSSVESTTTSNPEITTASDPENNMTSDTENTMTYNKNKISKNKEVRTNKEKILKENSLFPQFTEIANRIKQLIETQKRINITNSQLSNWTTEISKLYKTLESARGSENAIYSMFLIINTLNADIHYEDKYKPVIESGKSFREKFIKIEDYYKRRQMQYMKQKQDEDCDDLII
ncbi:MAG TPA: hypothetical protein VLL98_02265 [Rickettsiales bacterium]|nr:hypothetical protein [Rickettsiales bacterium]